MSQYAIVTQDSEHFYVLADGFFEIHESWQRQSLLKALISLATQDDRIVMLDVLKAADDEEAGQLVTWFVRYPSQEATSIIRRLVNANYREKWELAFGLASLGDPDVVEWAKAYVTLPVSDVWKGYYILARSPLLKADLFVQQIIQGKNPAQLISLLQGYRRSSNPYKWERIHDIIQLNLHDEQVHYALKSALEVMAYHGQETAEENLKLLEQ